MSESTWLRDHFTISTFRGEEKVFGYRREGYGVHKSSRSWIVTHLRTGAGFYWNGKTAKYAREVADAVAAAVPEFATVGTFGGRGIPEEIRLRAMKAVEPFRSTR